MRSDLFQIRAAWGPRQEAVEDHARRLSRMLNDVSDVHRGFTQLMVDPDWGRGQAAAPLPRRVVDIVPFFSPVRRYDENRRRFVVDNYRLNASARLVAPRLLVMSIIAGKAGNGARYPAIGNQVSVSLKILEGGNDEDQRALAAIKPILLALVSAWEPEHASAASDRYGQPVRKDFVHGTWAAYFAAGSTKISLTSLGVARRLADGGLLWCATEEAFDLDNPVHLGAAAAMHAALPRE